LEVQVEMAQDMIRVLEDKVKALELLRESESMGAVAIENRGDDQEHCNMSRTPDRRQEFITTSQRVVWGRWWCC
jgi:hypothetical protein